MENIHTWQYFVIAGPAFMAGCWLTYRMVKDESDRMRFIQEYIIGEKYKDKEIADWMMQGLSAESTYGREHDV